MAKVVADIGGSGTRIGSLSGSLVAGVHRAETDSLDDLAKAILEFAPEVEEVGLSVPGVVDTANGRVEISRVAPWLEGDTADGLRDRLDCDVHVLNDGTAHALAMLREPELELGAICLSVGTSVGFGAISHQGEILPSLTGLSWEVGDVVLRTGASQPAAWWALGKPGLTELQQERGEVAGLERFGLRLGAFARTLAAVFQAQTVGFSGGLVARYWRHLEHGVRSEIGTPLIGDRAPLLLPLSSVEPALDGLGVLLRS